MSKNMPVVLTIGGHDPSGGAGITSDVNTIYSLKCHPLSLISCITNQNTKEYKSLKTVDPIFFAEQADSVLSDVNIDAVKIGVLGDLKIVEETRKILDKLQSTKIVIDPVLKASSGGILSSKEVMEAIKPLIFPKAYLATPNFDEVKELSGENELSNQLNEIFSFTSKYLLIKDIGKSKNNITNKLFLNKQLMRTWSNPRIEGYFHGTGCYLASSIACFLARNKNMELAIDLALKETNNAIKGSFVLGKGQKILRKL